MRLFSVFLWVFLFVGAAVWSMAAAALPVLQGEKSLSQCQDALLVAEDVFQSKTTYLYAPPAKKNYGQSRLAMTRDGVDISGGDALLADSDVFEKRPLGSVVPRSIYWEIDPKASVRIAIRERGHGWRGDQYYFYEVPKAAGLSQSFKGLQEDGYLKPIFGGWSPPLVFLTSSTNSLWVLRVAEPASAFADWQIYIATQEGYKPRCSIRFRPAKEAPVLAPLRKLMDLLNQALGPGLDEGTLQVTAHLRVEASNTWENVQLRPWALPEPYNSREQVDAGLLAWSQQGDSYRRLYRQITAQYVLAEKALASYYQAETRLSSKAATDQAKRALDIGFRDNFMFPGGKYNGSR